MQVPEHVVSLYVATCGQNGNGLGSDEKEIILLVYVILEAATGKIIGTKQLLVRPDGSFVKDRTISVSSDTSNTAAASPPPALAITYTDLINNSNCGSNINNNNNNSCNINNNNININNNLTTSAATAAAGVSSLSTTTSSLSATVTTSNTPIITNSNAIISSNNLSTSNVSPINNNNIAINNNNNNSITSTTVSITNGPTAIAPATITATAIDIIELPIAAAQAAGKPLNEAIEEFDEYLRSLSLNDIVDIKLITDGQLPLRQCLHREACAKDVELPAYYNKFCDLRKEFLKYKLGDLSRALVPVKDKKILQMPTMPAPQNITEMMKELNIVSTEDTEFYIRESRDMVSVIQTLLKTGHKFTANEIVSLVLEPGICSIDDEIDGNCIVRARGLPWQSSDQDIAKFFRGLNVAKGGVALCLSPLGRRNGEALIRFVSQEHRDMALKRHKHHIGNRYIEVYRATGEDFLAIAGGASNEAQAFLSKGAQVIIRMRGLPYDCTAKQVLDFFTNGDNPCNVLDGTEGVLFVKKPDGRATGDAFVLFANESDAPNALSRHRESIGQRYIELFRSTTAEVQQVLNRSMDPKTYETSHQPPLITQLHTMQLSLMPQHLITSGTTKNCIRLRGLPYEALVEHILHFLDDFAKHIIYQGVHMVINAQGQPSGEAFIQMDTEESARHCAQRKHNHFMVFGKKYRYIEVFQCSGDDMNMVLNGGLQSPLATPHHAHHPGGKQPSLLSPGASVIGAPLGPFTHHFGTAAPALFASPHRHAPAHPHAPQPHSHPHPAAAAAAAAFYPHHLVYWPYPSPPVSPTTYFSQPTHSPTHVAGNLAAAQHQAMYSLDFLSAVPPPTANYAAQPSALSPPNVAIAQPASPALQQTAAAGLIISPNKTPQAMTLVPPKQFSTLTPSATASNTATPSAVTASTFHHNKMPQQIHHGLQAQQQQQQLNNRYHYQAPTAAVPTALVTSAATTPAQALLTIDTSHGHGGAAASAKPLTAKITNNATAAGTVNAAAAGTVAAAAPSGQQPVIVTANQCVELFIS